MILFNETKEGGIMLKAVKEESSEIVEESSLPTGVRVMPYSMDDHYIDTYLANPFLSHRKCLKMAYDTAGIDKIATQQRAYEIHNRLRQQIDIALVKKAKSAKAMGLETLIKLCTTAESESVRAQVATTLTKDLFPDAIITKDLTGQELMQEIERVEHELSKERR